MTGADGSIVAVVDVINITHAAVATVSDILIHYYFCYNFILCSMSNFTRLIVHDLENKDWRFVIIDKHIHIIVPMSR